MKTKSLPGLFTGFLLGSMTYAAFLQYHDTGTVAWSRLFLDPKHWFIAGVVALGVGLFRKIRETQTTPDSR